MSKPTMVARDGGYRLSVASDPAGYSEGTWEYVIADDGDSLWFDGGYASRDAAFAAGRDHLKRLGRVAGQTALDNGDSS